MKILGKERHSAQGENKLIDQRLKIAVFIDFDNIEIGVKTTLHTTFDIAAILEGIKERGEVVTKVAYGDWKRAGDYGRLLSQHAIRMVQRNLTPGGDKNGADINLALDALEMAFTHDHINAFVIVGGDSDFITLVEKLKQYDKKVFVVGGRQFTSQVMQRNCHEFIAYENLIGGRRPAASGPRRDSVAAPSSDFGKVIPLVKRALKVLADREVSPQLGLLKSTLLQLDSTFSERDYGAGTFRDFIEKIAKTGIITLRHAGRSTLVDLAEGAPEGGDGQAPPVAPPEPASAEPPTPLPVSGAAQPARDPGQVQQAIDQTRELFARPRQPPRWPMYVRQLKQYLRTADSTFDERKWGFATIMEFLRVCQREGLFRLERDRRGQIRVFPGNALQSPAETGSAVEQAETADVGLQEPVEAAPEIVTDVQVEGPDYAAGIETIEVEPIATEVIEVEESEPAPARPRRTRKGAAAGKPPARRRAPRRRPAKAPQQS
jgi:uncharacterized LabA/DUF88 family protein